MDIFNKQLYFVQPKARYNLLVQISISVQKHINLKLFPSQTCYSKKKMLKLPFYSSLNNISSNYLPFNSY